MMASEQKRMEANEDQVTNLMKSIQQKLSMLACQDDSIPNFEQSKLSSPKREFLTATNEKYNRRMNILDLETEGDRDRGDRTNQRDRSFEMRDSRQARDSLLGQSRIVARINEMETYYMQKIQQLSSKLSSLQTQLQSQTQKTVSLQSQNTALKQSLVKYKQAHQSSIQSQTQKIKQELIHKFSIQAQQHYQQHIQEMKALNQELMEERGRRKYLQQEVELLNKEKNGLEGFYRQLLDQHRKMIRGDIQRVEMGRKGKHSREKEVGQEGGEGPKDSPTKKKSKRKEKNNTKEEMTKQEMIPFLAKGIQDLKDKLKIK